MAMTVGKSGVAVRVADGERVSNGEGEDLWGTSSASLVPPPSTAIASPSSSSSSASTSTGSSSSSSAFFFFTFFFFLGVPAFLSPFLASTYICELTCNKLEHAESLAVSQGGEGRERDAPRRRSSSCA